MRFPFFDKARGPSKGASHRVRPALEALEDRVVLTAYVFVDFGDNFPVNGTNRVLATTAGTTPLSVGAIRDVAGAQLDNGGNLIPNTVIPGPQLTDANNNNYADTAAVNFTRFNFTTDQRAQMMAVARRAFASVDVTVVELTATAQTLADGRTVAGAANLIGVTATLRGNNTNTRDVYVIAATPAIGPSNDNPNSNAFGTNAYGGIAPGGNVLGDATDLQSSFNNHDDLVLAFTVNNLNGVANTIVHEAGHALGLRHSVTTAAPPGSAINNAIPTSEVMSYLSKGNPATSSFFFSRFPMVRGDNNTDPNTTTNPPTPPPLNNNDLEAQQGQQTPFDQLRADANVGENPNLHYISGTGAHDIIGIFRGAGNTASVTVRAFADSAHTIPIVVPGTTFTAYSYTVDLDRQLLVQGGLGDDLIIVEGVLNARVDVDGMGGDDELVIDDSTTFANFAMNYTVTAGQVTRERIDFIGAGFQSTWLIVSHAGVDQITLNAGSSATPNVITVGQAAASVDGRLTIRGGAGLDVLTINDQELLLATPATYTVTATEMTRERFVLIGSFLSRLTVAYTGIEDLALNAGGSLAGSNVNVNSLPAAPVTVNLGSAVNFVTVGQAAASVDGQLTVNGGAGFDLLTINDQALLLATPAAYTVTATEMTRERFVFIGSFLSRLTVGYTGIEDLTLNAGGSLIGSNVNVNSLPATPVTINLGSPVNVVTVGLPAVSVDGRLTVNGGAGLDLLTINDQALLPALPATYTVTSTEVARERLVLVGPFLSRLTVDYAGIDDLTLNAGGSVSGCNVNVNSLPAAPVTLNLSSVVNVVAVGQAAVSVDGRLTVNGGAGLDLLTINDQALLPATPATYTVTSTEVTRERFVLVGTFLSRLTVGYAGIDDLTLNAGGSVAGSIVNVNSLPAAQVTLNLSSVVNVVTVGQAAVSVDGRLTVNGGAGVDLLTINDQALLPATLATYTVTATEIARERLVVVGPFLSRLTVGYAGIEDLTLNAGGSVSGSNVNVLSVAANTPMTLTLNSVVNVVTVGDGGNSLDLIAGPLTVHGSGGPDVLTLNDQGSGVSQVYDVTTNRVTRAISLGGTPPSVSITYDAIESLSLNTGSGGSIAHVDSTAAGTSTTVTGHANALDIFTVGFAADTNRILGPVNLAGQAADNDFAYYYEFLNPNPQTYTVQSILPSLLTVSRSGIAPVSYQGLAGVSFLAPAVGGSYLNVQSTPAGTQLGVAAGNGDHMTLGSNAPFLSGTVDGVQGHVFVAPGVGATLIVDDSGNDATPRDVSISRFEFLGTVYGSIDGFTPGGITFLDQDNWTVDLRGGKRDDRFLMSGSAFDANVVIDGGGGVNTLDYSAYTGGVVVNLPLQTATGLRGGITNIQNVVGSAGNDILVGDALVNVLRGGAGRDLLIGGRGADLLDGGADDDILIGGWTDYDTNASALVALLAAWAQPLPYNQRIENLMDNGVAYPGGTAFLNKDRVHDDQAADVLTGGPGRDWFFRDPLRTGLDAILDLVENGHDKERVTVTRN